MTQQIMIEETEETWRRKAISKNFTKLSAHAFTRAHRAMRTEIAREQCCAWK